MKDFSPHAVLKHPSISDEEVERLLNSISSRRGGPVVLLLDPPLSPTPRDGKSSQKPWPVSECVVCVEKFISLLLSDLAERVHTKMN